jgi:hypothetical protein
MNDEHDDGLGFFRGLVAGVSMSLAMWLGIFLAAGWV